MQTLSYFHTHSFLAALKAFFEDLNVPLHYISDLPARPEDILGDKYKAHDKIHALIEEVYPVGLVDDAVFNPTSSLFPNKWTPEKLQKIAQKYEGLLIFGLILKARPARSELAEITRTFNRAFPFMPVLLVFRYENYLTLAHTERTEYKQAWREGEKMGKVTLLKDINIENPHTGHIHILQKLAIQRAGKEAIYTFAQLYAYWQTVLNVATLNKLFYKELFDWYLLANKDNNIVFNTTEAKETPILIIKLITRIIFLWFLKERKLVSEKLFDLDFLQQNLRNFAENDSSYYKGILQNLFFNVLNQKIENRFLDGNEVAETLYFQDFEAVKTELNRAPFVNGGLFDATVAEIPHKSLQPEKLAIPNFLFFEGKRNQDFSSLIEGDKKATQVHVLGMIPLLEKYKFTIEENTPIEEEVALDPELLGKIFESLLAAYQDTAENTKISARKATGSFYTPREIVEYMVDESLMAFLKEKVQSAETAAKLPALLSYQSTDCAFDEAEQSAMIDALDDCKILDPACGSGAFPMGVLAKMTHILAKIDPENRLWFEKLIGKFPQPIRAEMRTKLKDENGSYLRKFGIILNSIYGIDIQPVAVQIAKLRCFISLIIDQKTNQNPADNYGVKALPNLEFKFVAANTLIDAPHFSGKNDPILQKLISKFGEATENYFYAATEKKESLKAEIKDIVNKITSYNNDIILQNRKKIAQESGTKMQKQGQKKAAFNLEGNTEEPVFVAENEAIYEKKSTFREKNIADLAEAQSLWDSFQHIFQEKSVGFFNTSYFFPAVKEGFDIVIGNPPYGAKLSEKEKIYFTKNYQHQDYQLDSYLLFMEKGHDLLKEKGILSFIIPNTWLINLTLKKIRQFIWKETQLIDISHYEKNVFTAVVNTDIFVLKKMLPIENEIKIRIVSKTAITQHIKPQSRWKDNLGEPINIFIDNKTQLVLDALQKDARPLTNFCQVVSGMIPYEKGKGNPKQTAEMVQNRTYDAEYEVDSSYKALLRGSDIQKYVTKWDGKRWIKYGDNLAAPRYSAHFEAAEKIVIRQTSDTLIATLDTQQFICMKNMHVITLTNETLNLKYILAMLNSKLLDFYHQCLNPEKGEVLAEIKKENVEKLRIKALSHAEQEPFIRLVEYVLWLKGQENPTHKQRVMAMYFERLIDSLIYELYFGEEMWARNCVFERHLPALPALLLGEENEIIMGIYAQLTDRNHLIDASLVRLLNIHTINLIEGRI